VVEGKLGVAQFCLQYFGQKLIYMCKNIDENQAWFCPREVMAKALRHSEHFAI